MMEVPQGLEERQHPPPGGQGGQKAKPPKTGHLEEDPKGSTREAAGPLPETSLPAEAGPEGPLGPALAAMPKRLPRPPRPEEQKPEG